MNAEAITDSERRLQLRKVWDSRASLGDWETQFVADLLLTPRPMTDQQRCTVDSLVQKYHEHPQTYGRTSGDYYR